MKDRTFNVLSGVALALLVFVLARASVSELRYVHERSSAKAILAALAADVRSGSDLRSIFHQSQLPYRMEGESYTNWMEERFRNGQLDPTNNDFRVDGWGNRYEIVAEANCSSRPLSNAHEGSLCAARPISLVAIASSFENQLTAAFRQRMKVSEPVAVAVT
jgi:hypothetical protein